MPDVEDVIKGLECCSVPSDKRDCDLCPIGFCEGCALKLKRDALALLKAQEPVEPTWRRGLAFCGKCGRQFGRGFKYCPDCGRAVKWDG